MQRKAKRNNIKRNNKSAHIDQNEKPASHLASRALSQRFKVLIEGEMQNAKCISGSGQTNDASKTVCHLPLTMALTP